jgi:hypothetical protein
VTGPLVAYAVVRDDPPAVYVAEDLEVLQRALALHLVARTETHRVGTEERDALRQALLEERWGEAVHTWINHTGIPIDVYTERVLTSDDLPADLIGAQLQFAPLFRGD